MKKTLFIFAILLQCITFQIHADTVVGIHGFLGSWRTMKPIKHCLENSGYCVYLWEYPSRKRCFQDHAINLVCRLQEIAYSSPGEPIHFVAHSSGSIILRAALNSPNCPEEARMGRAVLFAPPSQGSSLGRRFKTMPPVQVAMGGRSGGQLLNYTACEMQQFGEFPPSMEVLVLAGTCGNSLLFNVPNDGYVTVEETYLNTPFYFACFPASHGEILKYAPALCCMRNFICNANLQEIQHVEAIVELPTLSEEEIAIEMIEELEICDNVDSEQPEEEEIAIEVTVDPTADLTSSEKIIEIDMCENESEKFSPEPTTQAQGENSESITDYSKEADACHPEDQECFHFSGFEMP